MTSMQEIKRKADKLAPADDSVVLPAAIRAAAQRSATLHQQAYQSEQPKEPDAPATPAEPSPDAGSQGEPKTPDAPPAPAPEAGTEGVAPAPKDDSKSDWEHKYNSMKGRYDRAESTISGLNQRISQLEALLARAQSEQPKPQQPTPDLTFKSISKDERETYGDDFLDVAARAAQEKLNPEIAELKAKLARLEGTVGNVAETTQRSAAQSVNAYLDEQVPNWRQLNRDDKFLAWANLPDPLSGGIRITMLRDAHAKGDAQRVARFFQGFLADEAATAPAVTVLKPDASNKVPLENFAAPGRATAPAATSAPVEKETITRAQIAAFYADVNRGKYRGNTAEKDRLEQMIFQAEAEGRIV
jgi:hypothetical protein